jgi:hypothetical protein
MQQIERQLQSFPFLIIEIYSSQKIFHMSKEKDGKKKSDKTPPAKSAKEKREDKMNKRRDRENESRNTGN